MARYNSGKTEITSPKVTNSAKVSLPTISIPAFSGKFDEWINFRDLYESLIHGNHDLAPINKLHYLRSSLKGDALKVVESVELSNSNYEIAWELLCNRYNNNKLLVHHHVKALFDLPPIVKDLSGSIRQMLDSLLKNLRALGNLGQPVDAWDTLLIYILIGKLDKGSVTEWEKYKLSIENPTLDTFRLFLTNRAELLESLELYNDQRNSRVEKPSNKKLSLNVSSQIRCYVCKGTHMIYKCNTFIGLSPEQRLAEVNKLKLCSNCLTMNHTMENCKRFGSCKQCKGRHNTLLHIDANVQESVQVNHSLSFGQVLLSTALVNIADNNDKLHTCRLLLDSGSQSNFISEKLVSKLNLKTMSTNIAITGINRACSNVTERCNIKISSIHSNFTASTSCLVLPDITDNIPSQNLNTRLINIPRELTLADPEFHLSKPIDLLIGASLFWDLIKDGKISLGKNKPTIQNTELGWIVSGSLMPRHNYRNTSCNLTLNAELQEDITKFWEVDECYSSKLNSIDEECEIQFKNSVSQGLDGRFCVKYPLKYSTENLGDSKATATKRLLNLERRLDKNIAIKQQYHAFMKEYEQLGHMTKLKSLPNNIYFLPHHAVVKEDSTTTRLRVVFDGSAATSTGWSLNDLQHTGPKIHADLFNILIRFRRYKFVVSADIEKMYRQILIHTDHKNLQCILWREDSDDPISTYQLNTLSYGTAAAPYLAIRCLHHLAQINKDKFPEASSRILNDFYVDDLITGFDTESQARSICDDINNILKSAQFPLRKWISNCSEILSHLDSSSTIYKLILDNDQSHKTLGIRWLSTSDILTYDIVDAPTCEVSKRSILSTIAKIFDPLGLISPSVIIAKILIQKLWVLKINWDDLIPQDLSQTWHSFKENLSFLRNLQIKRHAVCVNPTIVELHGFSDASTAAYGACIYVRSIDGDGNAHVSLLCSKSKVAPLKQLTIPRLELCAALLLSKLMVSVKNSLSMNTSCYYWSDSQVVLCWLKLQPKNLSQFVGNRVSEIQTLTNVDSWQYINTKENPADLISRGVCPSKLVNASLWWNGPQSLSLSHLPKYLLLPVDEVPELKVQAHIVTADHFSLWTKYSNLDKLVRVVAWTLRFISNIKTPHNRSLGPLTHKDIRNAMNKLVKIAQGESFLGEYKLLPDNSVNFLNKSLKKLNPFIDEGLLRVGGRLENSNLSFHQKHPLILSHKHPLTKLIIAQKHSDLLHAGPQLLLSSLRQKYWITSGMSAVKSVVRSCVKCIRNSPKLITQQMADLPKDRVLPSPPFNTTGIDYAGPFTLKDRKGRGYKTYKAYLCLYVCFTTKAVHLDVVTDLSADGFISSLRRFVSRRGLPKNIYSDNATNFVGASNQLRELYSALNKNISKISSFCSRHQVEWHFIPPNSPHFGGLWESAVKSAKYHFRRVIGEVILTYEEFSTIFVQIEAILNSRPLCPLTDDPSNLDPLTPAHFLVGRPLTALPDEGVTHLPQNRLSRFQLLQQLQQGFWKRWSEEYLTTLQQRHKWVNKEEQLKINDLVLIKSENLPPMKWPLGRILDIHPGKDGLVRVVTIKINNGIIKRAVTKLCPLIKISD